MDLLPQHVVSTAIHPPVAGPSSARRARSSTCLPIEFRLCAKDLKTAAENLAALISFLVTITSNARGIL